MLRAPKEKILVRIVQIEKPASKILMIKEEDNWLIGKVACVGEGVTCVKTDEFVWFQRYRGAQFVYGGELYFCLDSEDDLWGISDVLA